MLKVRDNFENKKDELEAKLTALLKTPWTIAVDMQGMYSYTNETGNSYASQDRESR